MPWPSRTISFYSPTRQSIYNIYSTGRVLSLNTSKCHTVSIVGNGGLGKTVVDTNRIFHIKGQPLHALSREDSWKYLGIEFSPEGRRPVRLNNQLSPLLERLTKAPRKPQQRIFALKAGALPKVYYHMTLVRINISDIRKADKMVGAFLRQWITLPNDISIGYFHAPVSEGGLGIRFLRWLVPLHRKDRLLGLVPGHRMENITDPYLAKEIGQCRQRLTESGSTYTTQEEIKKRWAAILGQSIDSSSLKNLHQVTGQHLWVTDGTSFLSGRITLTATK